MRTIYVIGLLMILAAGIVGCASAGTGSSIVTANVQSSAGVTIASALSLTNVVPGQTATATDATFAVNANDAFTLTATTTKTNSGTTGGFLTKDGGAQLHNALQVKWTNSDNANEFKTMDDTAVSLLKTSVTSVASGSYTNSLILNNPIVYNDVIGTYTIDLTITATTTA